MATATMDAMRSVLIVDSNPGFARMLQESLEQDDQYRATVAHDGNEALRAISDAMYDLAIVDLGLRPVDNLDGATVARKLREEQDGLRLMLIPLDGKDLPNEEQLHLDVQGTLPKPFFLPDLPALLDHAFAEPIQEATRSVEEQESSQALDRSIASAKPLDAPAAGSSGITREMQRLAREINADAVLLTKETEILRSFGQLPAQDLRILAHSVAENYEISVRVAETLKSDKRAFEQSIEGAEYMLYSVTVVEGVILSVAGRANNPLGIIRHRIRATARHIRNLM